MNDSANALQLRALLGVEEPYVSYCREERNFAAILYHLLLDSKRLESFLALIGSKAAVKTNDVQIYFEYAHLRDLWATAAGIKIKGNTKNDRMQNELDRRAKNDRYREAIVAMLRVPEALLPSIEEGSCEKFNSFFTGDRKSATSKNHIQMPSRWSDSRFHYWSDKVNKEFAERACKLKWAFNAKPDLVLHLDHNTVLCIESKLESGVGRYQIKSDRYKLGYFDMKQTELQEFILENLLGYATDFIIISKNKTRTEGDSQTRWRGYSWHEVYGEIIKENSPMADESPMVAAFRDSKFIQPQ